MKTISTLALMAAFLILLNGCTSIVDATTNQPIESARDERTPGTYIDDRRLEVIVGVNLRKADPGLRQSNIDVTSFNGVVLITGQTKSESLKNLATATNYCRRWHSLLYGLCHHSRSRAYCQYHQ